MQKTSALLLPGLRSHLIRYLHMVVPYCCNCRWGCRQGGSARSGGYRAVHAKVNGNLLGGILGILPTNGEDAVQFVVVVCGCERVACGFKKQ